MTAVAVVTPSLTARGGTERIFAAELAALAEVASLTVIAPETALRAPALPLPTGARLVPVAVPPLPGLLRDEAWFRGATRAVASLPREVTLRYSPGMNALGLTHVTIHAIFADMAAQQRATARARGPRAAHRRRRYARIARWEARLLGERRVQVATVSAHAADRLGERYGRDDATVIPPAIDPTVFDTKKRAALRTMARAQWGWPADALVVVAVGNTWVGKGLDVMLQAWQGLVVPSEARLVIVTGERPRTVERAAGVRPGGVLWWSDVPQIADLYAAADVVVLPSRGETFGLPIAEAGQMGVAVLSSRHAGVAELLPTAAVVPDLEPRHWRERLAVLLHDRAACERAGAAAAKAMQALPSPAARGAAFRDWLMAP